MLFRIATDKTTQCCLGEPRIKQLSLSVVQKSQGQNNSLLVREVTDKTSYSRVLFRRAKDIITECCSEKPQTKQLSVQWCSEEPRTKQLSIPCCPDDQGTKQMCLSVLRNSSRQNNRVQVFKLEEHSVNQN